MERRESCQTQARGATRAKKRDGASRGSKAASGRATFEQTRLNRVICELADKGDVDGLLDTVQAKQAQMNLVNLSTAYHRLVRFAEEGQGKCWDEQDPRIQALQQGIREYISWLHSAEKRDPHPRCLATLSWAYGRLGHSDPEVMNRIGDLAMEWIDLFKPFELANLLWGFAKLQLPRQPLFQLAQDHVLANLASFAPRSLSVVAWAFATARPPLGCARLLCRLAEAFAAGVQAAEEKPVSLSNLVWALASTGTHPKPEVVHAIGDVATVLLVHFKMNELSITLWAFARLGCFHKRLFSAAMLRLSRDVALQQDMHPQGITNTLWAFARLAEYLAISEARGGGGGGGGPCAGHGGLPAHLARGLDCLVPTCLRLLPHLSGMELASTRASLAKLEAVWGSHTDAARTLLVAAEELTRSVVAPPAAWPPHAAAAAAAAAAVAGFADEAADGEAADSAGRAAEVLLEAMRFGAGGGGCCIEACEDGSGSAVQGVLSKEEEAPEQQPKKVLVDGLLASSGSDLPESPHEPAYVRAAHNVTAPSALDLPGPARWAARPREEAEEAAEAQHAAEEAGLDAERPCPATAVDLRSGGAGSVAGPVVISVVPEFSEVHSKDSKDASITVAVEIESLSGHEAVVVSVEVCSADAAEHCSSFVVNAEGLYRLSVPSRAGDWEIQLIAWDAAGAAAAQALRIPFTGAWSSRLEIDEVKVGKGANHSSGASDEGSTCASLAGSRFGSCASSSSPSEAFRIGRGII